MFKKIKFKQKQALIILLIILCSGALLRGYQLDQESLWTDEMVTLTHLRQGSYQEIISSVEAYELMPAGYFLLLSPLVKLFGDREFALRAFSALFDSVAIILVYLLGARFFGRKAGLVSALWYATLMSAIVYAQEARPYSLFGLLALSSTYLLVLWHEKDQYRSEKGKFIFLGVSYIIVGAISLYINYMALFLLLLQFLLTLFFQQKLFLKQFLKKQLLAFGAIILLFIPGIPTLWTQVIIRQVSLQNNLVLRGVPSFLSNLGIGFYLLPICTTIVGLAAVLFILRKQDQNKKNRDFLAGRKGILALTALILALLLQIIFLQTTLRSFALIRHSFFIIPFLIIVVAGGLLKLRRKIAVVVILLVVIFNLTAIAIYYQETTKTPWKEAVSLIESHLSGYPVVLFDRGGSNLGLYDYYQQRTTVIIDLTKDQNGPVGEVSRSELAQKVAGYDQFWFISSRNFQGKVSYQELLEKNNRKLQEYSFPEMKVIQFSKGK